MPESSLRPLRDIQPQPKPEDDGDGFNHDLVQGAGPLSELTERMPVQVAMEGFDADRFLSTWERMGQGMIKWDPLGVIKAAEDKPSWTMGDPYGATFGSRPGKAKSEALRKTAAEAAKAAAVERSGGPAASVYIDQVAKAEDDYGKVSKELRRLGLKTTQHWSDAIKDAGHHLEEQLGVDWQARHTPENKAKLWSAALLTTTVNNAEYVGDDVDKIYAPLVLRQMRGFYKTLPEDYTPEQFHRDFTDIGRLRIFTETRDPVRLLRTSFGPDSDKTLEKHYKWTFGKNMPADMSFNQMASFARSLVQTYDRIKERSHNAARWEALGLSIPSNMVGSGKLSVTELPFFRDVVQLDTKLRLAQVGEGDRHEYAKHQVRNDFIGRLAKDPADVVHQTVYGLPYSEPRNAWVNKAIKHLEGIKNPNDRYIEWSRLMAEGRTETSPAAEAFIPNLKDMQDISRRWDELFDRAIYATSSTRTTPPSSSFAPTTPPSTNP